MRMLWIGLISIFILFGCQATTPGKDTQAGGESPAPLLKSAKTETPGEEPAALERESEPRTSRDSEQYLKGHDRFVPPTKGSSTTQPPEKDDGSLEHLPVFIDQADLLTLESHPSQVVLSLKGSLPTPCHVLHVKVGEPDSQNRILVSVYSTLEPGRICAQVLEPFEENVPIKYLTAGKYVVWVNGSMVGEFHFP